VTVNHAAKGHERFESSCAHIVLNRRFGCPGSTPGTRTSTFPGVQAELYSVSGISFLYERGLP
jgi:hypothetical protein